MSEDLVYKNVDSKSSSGEELEEENEQLTAIECSSDDLFVFAFYACGMMKRWDTATWEIVEEAKMPFKVWSVSAYSTGKTDWLDFEGNIWVGEMGSLDTTRIAAGTAFRNLGSGLVWGLRKNGKELVTGSDYGIFQIWNCDVLRKSRDYAREIDEDEGFARKIELSANGKRAVSSSRKGKYYLWDYQTGREIQFFRDPDIGGCFALSPDGKMSASASQGCIFFWSTDLSFGPEFHLESNLSRGICRRVKWRPTSGGDFALSFSPDGQMLMAAGFDLVDFYTEIEIWDIRMRKKKQDIVVHGFAYALREL